MRRDTIFPASIFFSAFAIALLALGPAHAEVMTGVSKPTLVKADDGVASEADKRAKAVECSKKADAKGLHGEARKTFRSACKRGK